MKRGPGIGRKYKLNNDYSNVKFEVSTVSTEPLKSLQLETRFWYDNKGGDMGVKMKKLFRDCKQSLIQENRGTFDGEKLISILDLPDANGAPKSFIQMEFTFFPTTKFIDAFHISYEMTRLTDFLYENVFEGREDILKSKNG